MRFVLFIAGWWMSLVAVSLCAQDRPRKSSATGDVPQSKPKFTISKETTRIVGPLTPDGYVDYVSSLDLKSRKGITAENNAGVLLVGTIRPEVIGRLIPNRSAEFFKRIGIEPVSKKSGYLVSVRAAVLSSLPQKNWRQVWELIEETVYDQEMESYDRPWREVDLPYAATWIAANKEALETVTAGVKRARLYVPIVPGETQRMIGLVPVMTRHYRTMARLLVSRAMLHLGNGNGEAAQRDLLTCHRLARLVIQGPTLIDRLVGIAIEGIAMHGEVQLAHSGKLNAQQAATMRNRLDALPDLASIADCLDVAERYTFLDSTLMIAREGTGALAALGDHLPGEKPDLKDVPRSHVEWDEILRMGNKYYDRIVLAARKPTFVERMQAVTNLRTEIRRMSEAANDPLVIANSIFLKGTPPKRILTRNVGSVLLLLLLPATDGILEADEKSRVVFDLTQVTLALAQYHAEQGKYPDQLAELVPECIEKLPRDRFGGRNFHYKRTGDHYRLYSVGANQQDEQGNGIFTNPLDGDDLAITTLKEPESEPK